LDAAKKNEYCFSHEFFSNVLSVTTIPGKSPAEFLRAAVRFANENLWGTLGVNIIVHPKTMKELGPALDEAIAELRYGCIGVNAWIGVGFLLSETPGCLPGHARNDIRAAPAPAQLASVRLPQKSVVRQPFYPFPRNLLHGEMHLSPKPPWFVTNRQAHTVARRITHFRGKPRLETPAGDFSGPR
jgi:hypothetical protein